MKKALDRREQNLVREQTDQDDDQHYPDHKTTLSAASTGAKAEAIERISRAIVFMRVDLFERYQYSFLPARKKAW